MQINDIKLNDILVGDVWLCSGTIKHGTAKVKRVMDIVSNEILTTTMRKYDISSYPRNTIFTHLKRRYPQQAGRRITQKM